MLKNILIYLLVLVSAFVFSIFYYTWFSWYLLILVLCVPLLSLVLSLPFMISACVRGVSVCAQRKLGVGDLLCLEIAPNKGRKLFCPFIKIRFKFINRFGQEKKSMRFLYSGLIANPIYAETDAVTCNCGLLEITAKYCKIYDFLGIFFIPVKLGYHADVFVKPKPYKVNLPLDVSQNKVINYKKKPNGFADEYELRSYQKGDSLKNIHWKISARHNDLIVKDPIVPVFRPLVVEVKLTSSKTENNKTLSKLVYSACYLCDGNVEFYCALPNGEAVKINDKEDVNSYLLRLYKNEYKAEATQTFDNPVIYKLTHDTEAVITQ